MLSKYIKLVIVCVGLLTMSGATLGDTPGMGPGVGSDNETGQGDQDRGRTGECKDLIGVSGIHGGQCGEGEQYQKGRDDSLEDDENGNSQPFMRWRHRFD